MRSVRRSSLVVVGLAATILGAAPAPCADSGPVIVVPGRLGAPVLINGVDVTGAVIEGDFGLYRPQMVNPRVLPAPVYVAPRFYPGSYDPRSYGDGTYFPAFGHMPGYGRREVVPPADRPLPPPAQSYRRSWSTHSEPWPADLEPPAPLLVAPQIYPGGRRDDGRH
jgi:hypothetical protein